MGVFKGFSLVQKLIILLEKILRLQTLFSQTGTFSGEHSSRHYFRDQSPRQWQLCSPNRATKLIHIVWIIRNATLFHHIVLSIFFFLLD